MDDLELQHRLRGAVHGVPVPPGLQLKIGRRLRRPPAPWAQAVAAALVVAMAGAVAYQDGYLRLTPSSQASYIASLTHEVNVTMRGPLGDHVHCAVFREYPTQIPTLAQLAAGLGSFRKLVQAVDGRGPAGYQIVMAHECGFEGRAFTHIVFKSGARLLSLTITRQTTPAPAHIQEASVQEATAQRFQLAETSAGHYRICVISDLPEPENRATLIRMAPSIRNILNNT